MLDIVTAPASPETNKNLRLVFACVYIGIRLYTK